jgi:outer membrane biosynthesis protein TonB
MKTTIISFGLLASVLSTYAIAPDTKPSGALTSAKKEIQRVIHYPDFARAAKMEGIVMVKYYIAECGIIEVVESEGSHPELVQYVLDQMAKLNFYGKDYSSDERLIKITFRYQP